MRRLTSSSSVGARRRGEGRPRLRWVRAAAPPASNRRFRRRTCRRLTPSARATCRLVRRPAHAARINPGRCTSLRFNVKVSIEGGHFHVAVTPGHFHVAPARVTAVLDPAPPARLSCLVLPERKRRSHIKLTSHPGGVAHLPIVWGEADPKIRGPVIGSTSNAEHRNVIGAHAGSYAIYRALAVASGALDPAWRPDLTDTAPTDRIGPHPQWFEPERIVSLDPFG